MDLLCVERLTDSQFAINDKVIFKDMRVLRNLLDLEPKYIPPCNYFGTVQKDIQPFMRKVVATWMSEVCEEQRCEDQVFPLAVNFLDRFLCRCSISRRQLQLTAAVSLLLASKIRQCHALSVDLLCFYTDHSITPDEMRRKDIWLFLLRWLHGLRRYSRNRLYCRGLGGRRMILVGTPGQESNSDFSVTKTNLDFMILTFSLRSHRFWCYSYSWFLSTEQLEFGLRHEAMAARVAALVE
uniref:Cyclin-like domain-containing protein n=1 Tax=Timema tahoe TaxID=61484 RepID=A0A7R9FFQ2_9NEOP|nr:unnamed protein product [Timema tahoe]